MASENKMTIEAILNADESNIHPRSQSPQYKVQEPGQRREFRKHYDMKEVHFIFYHRLWLKWDWRDIKDAYNMLTGPILYLLLLLICTQPIP